MSAAALVLLGALRARGVRLRAQGDRLRWLAPAGALDQADLDRMRELKADLMAELQREAEDESLALEATQRVPYLGTAGELVIPSHAPAGFRWWETCDDVERARRFAAAREAAGVILQ